VLYGSNGQLINYTPDFNPLTHNYSATVENLNDFVKIIPMAGDQIHLNIDGVSGISGYRSSPIILNYGLNKIPIRATAPDGVTEVEYSINITRPVDPQVTLSTLDLSEGNLIPSFHNDVFSYDANVNSTTSSIIVSATAGIGTSVTVNNIPNTAEIPLEFGNNFVNVNVVDDIQTAGFVASLKKTVEYVVRVNRMPDAAVALQTLSVETNEGDVVNLIPSFSTNTLSYKATAANSVNSVIVNCTPNVVTSIVVVNSVKIENGLGVTIDLKPGLNYIDVVVIADNNKECNYVLEINKNSEMVIPKISFEKNVIKGNESLGNVKIPIILSSAPSGDVSINYTIPGGTATNGSDYELMNGTVVIPQCQMKGEIQLTIKNDKIIEND
jgi:hypothetical protein